MGSETRLISASTINHVRHQQTMSRYRKPLEVIDVDNDDEIIFQSMSGCSRGGDAALTLGQTPKKLDFTSTRKKGLTPKKRAIFTPMKIVGDVKPKLEPDSPTTERTTTAEDPKRAMQAKGPQPKVEPDLEGAGIGEDCQEESVAARPKAALQGSINKDVRPDVRALESLLGGLNLEQ